jgi:hypothetical protein
MSAYSEAMRALHEAVENQEAVILETLEKDDEWKGKNQ